MTTLTAARSSLRIADPRPDGPEDLLDLAGAMRERPEEWRHALDGKTLACGRWASS